MYTAFGVKMSAIGIKQVSIKKKYLNCCFSELQEEGDPVDVTAVISSCNLSEVRFLLDNFMTMAINKVPASPQCLSLFVLT